MNRIKIRLKSVDFRLLDQTCEKITTITKIGAKTIGPIIMPNASREGNTVYRRMIEIIQPIPSVVENLIQMKMSIGIDVELKQFSQ